MNLCCIKPLTAGKILNIWANSYQHHGTAQIRNIKKNKALFMKNVIILFISLGLFLCALSVGCTNPTQTEIKPEETTVPTPLMTTPTSVVTLMPTPAAVETLPPEQYVDINIEKQRPDATIHLLFNGGKGAIFVQNVMMRVTRSDGTVEEKLLNGGTRKPRQGDELVMDGTRGVDQVAVFVTSADKTYKIFDKPLASPVY
jgi:hypothetical protein